ncbi:MAG TPA: hypothetical protein VGM10_26415 [Actinocrinis sp.]
MLFVVHAVTAWGFSTAWGVSVAVDGLECVVAVPVPALAAIDFNRFFAAAVPAAVGSVWDECSAAVTAETTAGLDASAFATRAEVPEPAELPPAADFPADDADAAVAVCVAGATTAARAAGTRGAHVTSRTPESAQVSSLNQPRIRICLSP